MEAEVAKVAPSSAKATPASAKPPPAPPSTFSSDREAGKGSGKDYNRSGEDSKGNLKGKEPKGKSDSKGGKSLTKVKEEDPDASTRHYSYGTEREENLGVLKRQQDYEYQKWKDPNGRYWADNERKRGQIKSTKTNEEKKTLGFGEYRDWAYIEVPKYKHPYVEYLLKGNGKDDQCPQKKKFAARIRWGEEGIASDAKTGAAE